MENSIISIFHHSSANVRINSPGNDGLVIKAWEISDYITDAKQLLSHSHLQFLTSMEADACLNSMFDALTLGGRLKITVPDMDFYARQWLDAQWSEQTLRDVSSTARQSFAGLFGWQRGGNPMMLDYQQRYDDCHKSAYNRQRLEFLLLRSGFAEININQLDAQTLKAVAIKTMRKGERQISPNIHNIRPDHINRYEFAVSKLADMNADNVLDLACGVGYGAKMLASELGCKVKGVDLDKEAIRYADEHYTHALVNFICADARELDMPAGSFDAIVSFETIEHINFADCLLHQFHLLLRQGGRLLVSTPNQNVLPYESVKYPFHVRHYRCEEISLMLQKSGFIVSEVFTQYDPVAGDVLPGHDGAFLVIDAIKI